MALIQLYQCVWIFGGLCFTVSTGQETVGNSECKDSDICFTLYKTSPGFTRAQADTYCHGIGRSLAVIPDEDTQNVISRLSGRGTGTDQLAWVGGLRGRGTRWRDPGDRFVQNPDRVAVSKDHGYWCSGVKLSTFPGDSKVFPLPCSGTHGYRAVCEIGIPCSTDTSADHFNVSFVCHLVSDVTFTSWVEAQDHCRRTPIRGNLAFSVISRGSEFTGTYDKSEGYLWTGIQRRSWIWRTLTVSEVLLVYTNWLPSEPVSGECLVVDLKHNGGWRVSDCDVTRGYFICEGPAITTLTTDTTTAIATSSVSREHTQAPATTNVVSDPTQTPVSASPTTESDPPADTSTGIIGGSIGGCTFVAIVIITTLLIRRKIKPTATENSNLNSLEKNDVKDAKDGSKPDTGSKEQTNVPSSEKRRYDTLDVPKKNRAHLRTHPSKKHLDSMPHSPIQLPGNDEYITTQAPPSDTNNYENEGSMESEHRIGVVYEEVILETSEMNEKAQGRRLEKLEAITNAAHVYETEDRIISRIMSQQGTFENSEPQYLSPKRVLEDVGHDNMSQQSAVGNVRHPDMSRKTEFQNAEPPYLSPKRAVVDISQHTAVENVLPCTMRRSTAVGMVGTQNTSGTRAVENAGHRNMDQRRAVENEYVDDCSAPYIIVDDVENDRSVQVHNDYEEVVIVEDSSQL